MLLGDLARLLDEVAPTVDAESWDNVGLLCGDPTDDVTSVLLCIDYTPAVADEARAVEASLVVAYHPPVFSAVKRALAGSVLYDAARAGLSIYSPHTALDVAPGGTNDVLADLVRMKERAPLRRVAREGAPHDRGLGRIGDVAVTSRAALLARIKRGLGVGHLLVAGPLEGRVRRVAVCAGSAGELLFEARRQGAELYLTGEVRHHDALAAAKAGMTVVCALHSNSERVTLRHLAKRLRSLAPGVQIHVSAADRDPFVVV